LLTAPRENDQALAQESAGTAEPDQGAVDRPSCMGALQQQAMVQASVQRAAVHKRRIVALDRVGAGIRRRCCECCVGVAVGRRSVRQNPLVEAASAICAVELRR